MGIQITMTAEVALVFKKQHILVLLLWATLHQVFAHQSVEMAKCFRLRRATTGIRMMVLAVRVIVLEKSLVIHARQDQIVLLLFEVQFVETESLCLMKLEMMEIQTMEMDVAALE